MELKRLAVLTGLLLGTYLTCPRRVIAQADSAIVQSGDSVSIRLVDADLRGAIMSLARFLDRPVLIGGVSGQRITLETPRAIARSEVLPLLKGLLESQNLDFSEDTTAKAYRVRGRDQASNGEGRPPSLRSQGGTVPELFVVRLKHARATDVAATVNALYGRAEALGELGSERRTLPDQIRDAAVPPPDSPPPPEAVQRVAGRAAALRGEVTIVPDAGTNSLLIRASRDDFALLEAAVQELDIRPLQVLIEVLIAEVRKDRTFALGLETKVPETAIPNGGKATASASTSGLGLGDFVLKVMRAGGVDAELTLRAAAARGDVRIVSRPVVLTANNQTAEINVGSQRPFIQVSRSLPTDAPQRDQVVQYRDVGTKLWVKPTISGNGYVMLVVTQEVNAATSETAFDAPIISTRSVSTQLLIRDSQTVVLGGISDRQRDVNSGGVPILSRIPLIGALFGHQSSRTTETELFLFLKPIVIRDDDDAARASEPFRRRASGPGVPPP